MPVLRWVWFLLQSRVFGKFHLQRWRQAASVGDRAKEVPPLLVRDDNFCLPTQATEGVNGPPPSD